ncbi:hypothetical protein ACK317_11655 [Aeromonas dhakensis]|uniref:pPIWI-associating nuclease domain-containing protein n=1 Tax=Aeromonas dhakensis TaxID=196024 RepID=UPI0039871B4C
MAKVQQRLKFCIVPRAVELRAKIYKNLSSSAESQKILSHLSFGFEKDLYQAALNNLSDKGNPLRFNNFAYTMREIITLILSRYSSDEDILKFCWYINETDSDNGVTRAQRAKYAIQGGLSDERVFELLELDEEDQNHIKEKLKTFTKLFLELNEHTHLREKHFDIGDSKCEDLALSVMRIVNDILVLVEEMRSQIISHVESEVDSTIVEEFISNTPDEIDILSTHSVVDYIELESFHVSKISSEHIWIVGVGIAHCALQWGSNSDLKNDLGATMSESYPYDFTLQAPLSDLTDLKLIPEGLQLDTSSWWSE